MKTIFLTFAMWVSALAINAQPFNRTYFLPGYDLAPKSVAFLDQTGSSDFVVGSFATDVINPSNPGKYLLSKMDASGTPLTSVLRDDPGICERIVETFDDHIITVSEYFDKIVVRKYDDNLALLLSVKIDKGTPLSFVDVDYSTIDVEAVHNVGMPNPQDEEYYYIYFTEGYPAAVNPTLTNATSVSVLSLDRDLNLRWYRTYPEIRNWEPWQSINDNAYSMTKFPDPNNPNEYQFALAGTRNFVNPAANFTTFYMTIDMNGNIIAPYTEAVNTAQDLAPDILFDGDSLVVSYQAMHSNNINTNLSTMFSVMKFDIGLTSFRTRFYWNLDNDISIENYSSSIATGYSDSVWYEDGHPMYGGGTDNNYVIGGQTFPTYHQPTPYMNPILMSIDRISLDPVLFKRYNVDRWANAGTMGMFHRNDLSYRQYLPVKPFQSTGMRMIVTTPALNACGSETYDVEFKDSIPGVYQHNHIFQDFQNHTPYPLNETNVTVYYDDCSNNASPATYKSTGIAEANANLAIIQATVYPTLITDRSSEDIICNINSPQVGKVNISIVNLLGQQLYNDQHMITTGDNTLKIDGSHLTPGMNIITISYGNKPVYSSKLQVLN